jgi:hypothetical protein
MYLLVNRSSYENDLFDNRIKTTEDLPWCNSSILCWSRGYIFSASAENDANERMKGGDVMNNENS